MTIREAAIKRKSWLYLRFIKYMERTSGNEVYRKWYFMSKESQNEWVKNDRIG
jgi:hypothetical protein